MSTLNVTNISDGTNTTATTNVVKGSAKAWVNFNGTGTVAIREAYNVGSITDNGTGQYTVNFTNAMVDANYAVVSGFNAGGVIRATTLNSSNVRLNTVSTSFAFFDPDIVLTAVFR